MGSEMCIRDSCTSVVLIYSCTAATAVSHDYVSLLHKANQHTQGLSQRGRPVREKKAAACTTVVYLASGTWHILLPCQIGYILYRSSILVYRMITSAFDLRHKRRPTHLKVSHPGRPAGKKESSDVHSIIPSYLVLVLLHVTTGVPGCIIYRFCGHQVPFP